MRHQRGKDAEIRLVITLHAVVSIDAPFAERLLPEERHPFDARDVHRCIRSQRDRIRMGRERGTLAKMKVLAANEKVRVQMNTEHIRDPTQLRNAKVRKRRRVDGTLLHRLDLLQSEHRAACACIVHNLRQHGYAAQTPCRKCDALIGAEEGLRVVERTALERLAFLRQDLLHIVPRIHTQHIRRIVDDEELLARQVLIDRGRTEQPLLERAIAHRPQMEKAVETAVLEEQPQQERNAEQNTQTAFIHEAHLHPSNGSPASPHC